MSPSIETRNSIAILLGSGGEQRRYALELIAALPSLGDPAAWGAAVAEGGWVTGLVRVLAREDRSRFLRRVGVSVVYSRRDSYLNIRADRSTFAKHGAYRGMTRRGFVELAKIAAMEKSWPERKPIKAMAHSEVKALYRRLTRAVGPVTSLEDLARTGSLNREERDWLEAYRTTKAIRGMLTHKVKDMQPGVWGPLGWTVVYWRQVCISHLLGGDLGIGAAERDLPPAPKQVGLWR